jgi:hypothetical protein
VPKPTDEERRREALEASIARENLWRTSDDPRVLFQRLESVYEYGLSWLKGHSDDLLAISRVLDWARKQGHLPRD